LESKKRSIEAPRAIADLFMVVEDALEEAIAGDCARG